MKPETAKELLPILEAYSEGKSIQCRRDFNWIDLPDLSLSNLQDYLRNIIALRVKPESQYRPFTFEDAPLFIGKSIVLKSKQRYDTLISIHKGNETITCSQGFVTFRGLFEKWTFLDGSPCGVLVKTDF